MLFDTGQSDPDALPAAVDVRQDDAWRAQTGPVRRKVFTTANLKLLRQIAERVAIAVDNALAYQEIHRLKERPGRRKPGAHGAA